ncbi:putative bifunctional diguanylate cyclase/phosphodiesterase [Paucibacter sp. XJ19-41]|uniref:putative bifunctional diguanylate cyclase/phosphodiesterase n=1 Tax=Paucibacter sp. XJ19-41 TaxID=2927824 RepID=UPI00234BE87C|nr:EAL domain-containing protein [Paucibacter sp. XJ19-41]MDC6166699.1 EAL domain-containing protein [Paucibacter sp. XJ19-41]
MRPTPPRALAPQAEISELIEDLHAVGQRLEDLTAGEVDAVADHLGRPFQLRSSQEYSRQHEAVKQAAILNALPAHIAVLDNRGVIVSVNKAWQRFAEGNALQGAHWGVGADYLQVCDRAQHCEQARPVAAGIRAVLHQGLARFAIEYPCHAPQQQRWFEMTVTPLGEARPTGAVVMHLDISTRKLAEQRIAYLNRVHAVLSGINALIVRVGKQQELFDQACRIALEQGGFRMALIGAVEPGSASIVPQASAGVDAALLTAIRVLLASPEGAANSMLARSLREQRAIVANDSQHDPQVLLGPRYIEAGVRSMAVLPLIVRGAPVGVLALYASESEFFHAEELTLLGELAGDIAFAIDHIGKQQRLDYLAYYDELTGLANRSLFLDRVTQHLRSATAGGHRLALFLVDLERFKNINDSLGRAAGDALLRQVADWLTHKAGDAGLFARIGADHFAAMLPVVKPDGEVTRLLEKTIAAFLEHPFRLNDAVFRVSVKVGVALFPADGGDAATLFKNAEAALKKAKAGGDRYLLYKQAMNATVAGKLTLENQLRLALTQQQFVLHYQPKMALAGARLSGAEALIRWHDPISGLVPPGRFIPVLEETGLIHEVGRWALRKALEDSRRWRQAGLAAVRVAVNVSPLQLRDPGFIDEIGQAIGGDAQAAASLELEITETLIMEDVKHSIACLQAIRAMGVSIAIDDFGTGFSSLSYLARLPVDTLKIDQSFVADIDSGSQGLALVSTIVGLAHALGLKVVAEGVETEAQAALLRELRCDEMQGFLFSRPLAGEVFEARYLAPVGAA